MTGSAQASDRWGQPRGLGILAATELWDRISFHGMQSLLVLYMVDQLLLPGHVENVAGMVALRGSLETLTGPLSTQALATQVFGLYAALVAFTPVIGGFLGDRWLGRRRAVVLGGLMMTLGHFAMAFEAAFLLALVLIIVGAGCLRGNLAPQLGELYEDADRRRQVGFQIYGAMVNGGAFIAPLITGALSQSHGWHAGFGFAGAGMLVGLVIYLAGAPPERPRPRRPTRSVPAARLNADERRRLWRLIALIPVGALFWIGQSQIWNTYNLWVRDHVDLTIGGWAMPVPWIQSLDGLAPLVCLPLVLAHWGRQRAAGREPDELGKMARGCGLFALGLVWLSAAGLASGNDGRAPLIWVVVFHIISNLGWLYFAPSVNSLFSRVAPASVNATMVGAAALSVTLASLISGRLGGTYETLNPASFWLVHAGFVLAGALIYLALARLWRDDMRLQP
jgi:POT family proton-dependent oligopeptide transporter